MTQLSTPACGEQDFRCHCGQLLAKISVAGVELKCKRCKRIELVPWSAGSIGETA
jgi:hypothetical protein